MEEKVLIKSQRYNIKKLFVVLVLIGLCLSLIGSFEFFSNSISYYNDEYGEDHEHEKWCYKYEYSDDFWDDHWEDESHKEFEYKMDCPQVVYGNAFLYAISDYFQDGILGCLIPTAAFALIGCIIYLWLRCYDLTVTDKRIFGKLAWGKRVDLPIDSVSAVGIGAFKSITVSTSSGRIGFSAIKNRNEIHKVVSQLLVERQNQTTPPAISSAPTSSINNIDELKKCKELLDMGVITQEEFDAKKKQLLGL